MTRGRELSADRLALALPQTAPFLRFFTRWFPPCFALGGAAGPPGALLDAFFRALGALLPSNLAHIPAAPCRKICLAELRRQALTKDFLVKVWRSFA